MPSSEATVAQTLDRTVAEGRQRLGRSLPTLLVTGLVGGIDVGTGVLAYLLVLQHTGDQLLAGVAFSVGFIALTLAQSELFTENFLVPVTSVVARGCSPWLLLRLWAGTLVANLAGGWLVTGLVMAGYPSLRATAVRTAVHYVDLGLGTRAFALAMLAGVVITLMTWMQHGTDSPGLRLVPAVAFGALLAGGGLFHSVLDSLFMFAALHTGHAPLGYLTWLSRLGYSTLGNIVGGVGLVTMLRLLQSPPTRVLERSRAGAQGRVRPGGRRRC